MGSMGTSLAGATGTRLSALCIWLAAAAIGLGGGGAWCGSVPAEAGASSGYVDGISDQSLPVWDGSFHTSPFAGFFRESWIGRAPAQITLARYVVQWNVMAQSSRGPDARGDYRERFEAWLQDVRSLGLTPVVALTSYDEMRPSSAAEYLPWLRALLDRATAMGYPIRYIEPWNEPNGQGRESAERAAALANAADALCRGPHGCSVIAGDFEDRSNLASYESTYLSSLTFAPHIWGVHPYVSVRSHSPRNLRLFQANLPGHGVGDEIWFTEVGALYCDRGELRGEARQAEDASYLLKTLMADPAMAPAHVFYYGFLYGKRSQAPCTAGGGQDSELYSPADEPRAAAAVLLRGWQAGERWRAWNAAIANAGPLLEPLPA
jgi:hypothetical protein